MEIHDISAHVAHAVATAGDTPWLVGYDANGIQELITAGGRPIVMRGASEAILAFDKRVRESELGIFGGGGRGATLARSEAEARAAADHLTERFRAMTCGGVIATCSIPFRRDAEAQSIRWMRHQLDLAKDAAAPPDGTPPHDKASECAYCRAALGECRRTRDGVVEMVCRRCNAMLDRGTDAGKQRGADAGTKRARRGEMSESIAEIAENGWIAVVSADGNNLGSLFEGLRSLVELAVVSEAVAGVIGQAQREALEDVACVPLMTGGDDVRTFLPPSELRRYIERLVFAVEAGATASAAAVRGVVSGAAADQLARLGIGIGAVIANVYYPAWRLVDYAHTLERSAKAGCLPHTRDCRPGCLAHGWRSGFDFAIATNEDSLTGEPQRPDDCRPLPPGTPRWSVAFERARALAAVPLAQLGTLAEQRELDAAEQANTLRYQVARSPAWQAWYGACEVDWRDRDAVVAHRPGPGAMALMRLLGFERKEGGE